MEYPDIEHLQHLANHLTQVLEEALESFSRVDRRVRMLELARKSPPQAPGARASAAPDPRRADLPGA